MTKTGLPGMGGEWPRQLKKRHATQASESAARGQCRTWWLLHWPRRTVSDTTRGRNTASGGEHVSVCFCRLEIVPVRTESGKPEPALVCVYTWTDRPMLATQGDPLLCSCWVLTLQALTWRTFLSAASETEKHLSPPPTW